MERRTYASSSLPPAVDDGGCGREARGRGGGGGGGLGATCDEGAAAPAPVRERRGGVDVDGLEARVVGEERQPRVGLSEGHHRRQES